MKKSTTLHKLNSDTGLNSFSKALWFTYNRFENAFSKPFADFKLKTFTPNLEKNKLMKLPKNAAPSRLLCDLFWHDLEWDKIKEELGEINLFDTGCGKGHYALRLQDYSKGNISNYFGVDAFKREEWKALQKENPWITTLEHNSAEILDVIPKGSNVFISQSAIEHFEEDLSFFEEIRKYVDIYKKPVIQIHAFPSAACLKTYLLHGVRQYTPRTVSHIVEKFNNTKTYSVLYELGGKCCNQIHWEYITKQNLAGKQERRQSNPIEYYDSLLAGIAADAEGPGGNPSFYVLLTHSNYEKIIF
jgi:hypothetical protein